MATPFKMKGHTLPGPNQKVSPMKEPFSLTGALIGAGISAAIGAGTSAISASAKKKAAKKKGKEDEARVATKEVASSMEQDMGTKTKII